MTAEVQAEYGRLYGGSGDVSPVVDDQFAPPGGLFLVLEVDGEPAAMGGWRRGGPREGDAELKRMFVRERHRRRGLARVVLAELERTAHEAGLRRLVLETGDKQPEAIALYRSAGYVDEPSFGFYADYDDAVHLAKVLSP